MITDGIKFFVTVPQANKIFAVFGGNVSAFIGKPILLLLLIFLVALIFLFFDICLCTPPPPGSGAEGSEPDGALLPSGVSVTAPTSLVRVGWGILLN